MKDTGGREGDAHGHHRGECHQCSQDQFQRDEGRRCVAALGAGGATLPGDPATRAPRTAGARFSMIVSARSAERLQPCSTASSRAPSWPVEPSAYLRSAARHAAAPNRSRYGPIPRARQGACLAWLGTARHPGSPVCAHWRDARRFTMQSARTVPHRTQAPLKSKLAPLPLGMARSIRPSWSRSAADRARG